MCLRCAAWVVLGELFVLLGVSRWFGWIAVVVFGRTKFPRGRLERSVRGVGMFSVARTFFSDLSALSADIY